MKEFLLKLILGKDSITILRKYIQFKKPYSQAGHKLSDYERRELLKDIWPFLMNIFAMIELKGRKTK